ncbi:MAG TPA: DUF2147 domain-containing protein [Cyclobacteriaceae bacterium]|nr:DUF2147 domain-containing protein [Cyclobacteriaceae bacterium]
MKIPVLFLLVCFTCVSSAFGQDVVGRWKTIDDETGNPKSIVEIFEKGGKVYGKVVKLFRTPEEDPDPVCDECDEADDRYKKKVIGMEIMRDMTRGEGGAWSGGEILDPKNGKVYNCRIWLEGDDLKVRGYWGRSTGLKPG